MPNLRCGQNVIIECNINETIVINNLVFLALPIPLEFL